MMPATNIPLQTIANIIALIGLIMGLYLLILDARSSLNRRISLALFVLALNAYAAGFLQAARDWQSAYRPAAILAASTPLIPAIVLITTASLFFARSMQQLRWRWLLSLVLVFGLLPGLLTLLDHFTGSGYWFTRPASDNYFGGYTGWQPFAAGKVGIPLSMFLMSGMGLGIALLSLYVIITGKTDLKYGRSIAVVLFVSNLASSSTILLEQRPALMFLVGLSANFGYLLVFILTFFQDSTQPRQTYRSLQASLTLFELVIALPVIAVMGMMLTNQARHQLEANAAQTLEATTSTVVDAAEIWLTYSTRALRNLTANEAIISMASERQTPVLRYFTSLYPDVHLAGTIGLDGKNVARSDGRPVTNYNLETWFMEAAGRLPVSQQVALDAATGTPSLYIGMPIRTTEGEIIGVGMVAAQLTQIERLIGQEMNTSGSSILVVDDNNQLIASSDPLATLMVDLTDTAPIQALRHGKLGALRYSDSSNIAWVAHINLLSNGWGIIAQKTEENLYAPIRDFQRLSIFILVIGGFILMTLTWLSIRQALRPVRSLTKTAVAITEGDLTRRAPETGRDELGILAQSFNKMTAQLRDLISGLESRVNERTQALEQRAIQLQVTADVAREVSAIHDLDELLVNVTSLISEKFGYYHAGIFLLQGEEASQNGNRSHTQAAYAYLRAASSVGGRRMLERGHRLAVGHSPSASQGIVGTVAATGKSRIALDVGADASFLNNPDLPFTRSEMALPLKVGGKVIGVLDVQSREPSAFDAEDEATMQTLADLLAIAIENVRLIGESRQALHELESLYGRQLRQGWQKQLHDRPLVYHLQGSRIREGAGSPVELPAHAEPLAVETGAVSTTIAPDLPDKNLHIDAPIQIRGVQLGRLRLKRSPERGPWLDQEVDLAQQTLDQMAQALENARLVGEIQNQAALEAQVNQIVTRTQGSLTMEAILRTALHEIAAVVNAARVDIRLGSADGDPTPIEAISLGSCDPNGGQA